MKLSAFFILLVCALRAREEEKRTDKTIFFNIYLIYKFLYHSTKLLNEKKTILQRLEHELIINNLNICF
jgi:hypothetical protein